MCRETRGKGEHMTGEFHTMKGYGETEAGPSPAMEDYLEMIFRLQKLGKVPRVRALAEALNVRPPSASRMVRQLCAAGYGEAEPYGCIRLTEAGRALGEYLLFRHETVHRFLCVLNHTTDELTCAERIEHFLPRRTVENLSRLTEWLTAQER